MTYIEQLQKDKDDIEYGYATIISIDVPETYPEEFSHMPKKEDSIVFTVETKTGRVFKDYLRPPETWMNSKFQKVLDNFNLEPEEYEQLVGKEVPISNRDPYSGQSWIVDFGFFCEEEEEKDLILGE